MSLTATMQSWCHDFKTKSSDRSASVSKLTKHSQQMVKSQNAYRVKMSGEMRDKLKRHNAYRVKMSEEMRDKLKRHNAYGKKRVMDILSAYINDRSGAGAALAAMRGRQAQNYHKE